MVQKDNNHLGSFISKLVETTTNSNYLIGHLDNVIRRLVLVLPKMSRYVKTFQVKDGDKGKNNKLMYFRIDDEKLLEKYKTIQTEIEDLNNIELTVLRVYDDRYIKTKITTYGDKVYTNFHGLDVPEDDIECESFSVISIDSLFVYENKYYPQVYLDNRAYRISSKQITGYLDDNLFKTN